MKLKSFSITSLVAGIFSLAAGFLLPVLVLLAQPSDGSVGIIGGADMPLYITAVLLKRWPLSLILLGIALIITGLFSLVFSKTLREHCTPKMSALALALSAVRGLGEISTAIWLESADPTPILTIIASLVSNIAFIALVAWYCKERKAQWSWKGALIDLLTCMLYSPAFFYGFSMLW